MSAVTDFEMDLDDLFPIPNKIKIYSHELLFNQISFLMKETTKQEDLFFIFTKNSNIAPLKSQEKTRNYAKMLRRLLLPTLKVYRKSQQPFYIDSNFSQRFTKNLLRKPSVPMR